MQFKDILKSLREDRNLSQKELANACSISPSCICQLETGVRNPTGSTLFALADFFECSTDYLLGRSDELGIISIRSQTKTPAETLTADEKKLLEDFRALSPDLQEMIELTIQTWKKKASTSSTKKRQA